MTLDTDALAYYARQADREAKGPQLYGGDASIAGLRAFVRYHKDARQDFPIAGRLRSLTHKQVAMHGLVARVAVTQEHATVTSLAKEANVAPSTVSRFMLKLQAWGEYAIDVTRGRNGGVKIRLRTVGDQLKAYAERAWTRIRQAAERALSRTKLNVASTIQGLEEPPEQLPEDGNYNLLTMDATFSEAWDAAEREGARILAESSHPDAQVAPLGSARAADQEWARAEAFAGDVIAERARLDRDEPDWDLELEKVRASYGMSE